jgi:hypothetical protein
VNDDGPTLGRHIERDAAANPAGSSSDQDSFGRQWLISHLAFNE